MITTVETPFQLSDKEESKIKDKIESLTKFESRMTQVNVYFKRDDGKTNNAVLAEIRIRVPGRDIFVEDTDAVAMTAFNKAFAAAKRQVKKRRDKLNDHHSPVREINEIVNNTY